MGRRSDVAHVLTGVLEHELLRTHGRVVWRPGFVDRDVEPAIATVAGLNVKVQLLSETGYSPWPRERVAIEQRYADAPPAVLTVPTKASFAGWKTATWHDRGAARDLYDLWALARIGALTDEAAELFVEHGPIGAPPRE